MFAFWWSARDRGFDSDAAGQTEASSHPASPGDAVQEYVDFASTLPKAGAGIRAESLAEALRRLAGAVGAVGLVEQRIAVDLRIAAEHVLLNADSPGTTEVVRTNLLAVANALATRDVGTEDLPALVETIDARAPLLPQQGVVVQFLVRAAAALQRGSAASQEPS